MGLARHFPASFLRFPTAQIFTQRCRQACLAAARFFGFVLILA
jgi:hypothetical protein